MWSVNHHVFKAQVDLPGAWIMLGSVLAARAGTSWPRKSVRAHCTWLFPLVYSDPLKNVWGWTLLFSKTDGKNRLWLQHPDQFKLGLKIILLFLVARFLPPPYASTIIPEALQWARLGNWSHNSYCSGAFPQRCWLSPWPSLGRAEVAWGGWDMVWGQDWFLQPGQCSPQLKLPTDGATGKALGICLDLFTERLDWGIGKCLKRCSAQSNHAIPEKSLRSLACYLRCSNKANSSSKVNKNCVTCSQDFTLHKRR